MAYCALVECARVALQVDKLDRIRRLIALCDGMGAIVAALAVDSTMSLRLAVQSLVLMMTRGSVTGIAAWFI